MSLFGVADSSQQKSCDARGYCCFKSIKEVPLRLDTLPQLQVNAWVAVDVESTDLAHLQHTFGWARFVG